MFRVASQKKFYAIALIVALLTLKASFSMPSLQRSPSDLHAGGASLIAGTLAETSDGTPLRVGRARPDLPNQAGAVPLYTVARAVILQMRTPAASAALSSWLLAVGCEQAAAPQSDMVSRK